MKNKKLIIGLGLGIGAYLIWNLKRKKSSGVVEQVKETVEKAVEPLKTKDEEVFRGVNEFAKSTRVQNKQYVRIPNPHKLLGKSNATRLEYLQKGEDFEVENSRGERKKVLGYSNVGVILNVPITDAGQGGWLEKGETFKLLKV